MTSKLVFIGAGNMGGAIARGTISAKIFKPEEILVINKSDKRLGDYKAAGFQTSTDLSELKNHEPDFCIIGVKPKDINSLLDDVKDHISEKTVVISVAAGVKIQSFEAKLKNPIVRVMPNTPSQVMRGASGVAVSDRVSNAQTQKVIEIFNSIGFSILVDETKMNAVTAISGSGPAYIFAVIEAMTKAGIELGLAEHEAERLALFNCYGAGFLAFSKHHEALQALPQSEIPTAYTEVATKLREQVTSPGGTTAAALNVLKEKGLAEIFLAAMTAAANRGEELSV